MYLGITIHNLEWCLQIAVNHVASVKILRILSKWVQHDLGYSDPAEVAEGLDQVEDDTRIVMKSWRVGVGSLILILPTLIWNCFTVPSLSHYGTAFLFWEGLNVLAANHQTAN